MKQLLLPIALFLFLMNPAFAQQPLGACPGGQFELANTCQDACVLCDIDGLIGNNNTVGFNMAPPGFCGNQLHNTQWVGFVAGTSNIQMIITPFDCQINEGLQIGIYQTLNCENFQLVSECSPQIFPSTPATFNMFGLQVGGVYFIVIDGYNGDICNFNVDVTQGSTVVPPVSQPATFPPPVNSPFCVGETLVANATTVPFASIYTWTLNGVEVAYTQNAGIEIPLGTPSGTAELCVTPSNPCSEGGSFCRTIVISPPDFFTASATICQGESYTFHGQTFSSAGAYTVTDYGPDGCLDIYEFTLTVQPPQFTNVSASICQGDIYWVGAPFSPGSQALFFGGVYSITLPTVNGSCDSTVTVSLTVFPNLFEDITANICQGESVTIAGMTYSTTGVYVINQTTPQGCNLQTTLNLTVHPLPPPTNLAVSVCLGEYYVLGVDTIGAPGFYSIVLTTAAGCDSIVNLNLTVRPPIPVTEVVTNICFGESYLFNGDTLVESGSYSATFESILFGCDSTVNLTLTVGPDSISTTNLEAEFCSGDSYLFHGDTLTTAGVYTAVLQNEAGCDSIITLTLTALPTSDTLIEATICAGETYTFEGLDYTVTGVYAATYTNAVGCDSTLTLKLTVQPEDYGSAIAVSICGNSAYDFNGDTLTMAGVYTDTLTSIYGCDSTVTLTLTLLPVSDSTLEASFCAGDFYAFNGDTLTTGGVYTVVLTNSVGCDSTVTLNLTELETSETALEATICAETTYLFDGQELAESGVYTAVYTNEAGCDSTVTLNLTVSPALEDFIQAAICSDSIYDFHGDTLTQSGLYTTVLVATNGCDSTVTLSLTVLPVSGTDVEASICTGESYDFNGDALTTGGIYTAVLTNANGCDSTITLTLVELAPTQSSLDATICSDETYLFDGEDLSETGVYTAIYTNEVGCDSTVTLNLTVVPADLGSSLAVTICEESPYDFYGDTLTESGIYTALLTNENGCDSTITLTLTVREPDLTLIEASVCQGETYSFNGENLGAPGAYTALLVNSDGCDSLVVLNLSVLPVSGSSIQASFCIGDTYAFNGEELSAGGVYTALLTNAVGCDSTVTLTLIELATSQTLLAATICEGEVYAFEGQDYTESGVYSASYTNAAGCDSTVTLTLTVLPDLGETLNVTICEEETYEFYGETLVESGVYTQVFPGSNGCDSTITLNLTVRLIDLTLLEEFICEGQTYVFNGETLGAPGVYTALLVNSDGCDSLVILNLNPSTGVSTEFEDFICENGAYDFNGEVLTEPGIYTAMLTTEAGCDSTVTLTLTLRDPDLTLLEETICEGQSYEFNGETLFAPGAYTALLTNMFGCDSLIILNLTTLPTDITPTEATICEGDVYDFYGQSLTEQGVYVNALTNANGCDSNIVLTLNVLEPDTTLLVVESCAGQPVVFNGEILVAPGIYTAVLTNSNGCDSVLVLDLTFIPTTSSTTEASICANEVYTFNGEDLTEAGTYVFVLTNAAGCDSNAVLNLTVFPVSNTTLEASICEGETYLFNGAELTESGAYEATFTNTDGCDSTVVLVLQVGEVAFLVEQQGNALTVEASDASFQWIDCATNLPIEGATGNVFMPTVTGSYAVNVTQEGCSATSDCFAVTVVSTENPSADAGWQVLPNPTSGLAQLRMDAPLPETVQLQVFDMAGRLCLQQTIAAGETDVQVDLNRLSDGVFLARLSGGEFTTQMQRIVKVSK